LNNKSKKNITPVLIGAFSGAFFSFILCEVIRAAAAYLAGAERFHFHWSGIKLQLGFVLHSKAILAVLIYLIPFILNISVITSALQMMRKLPVGAKRHTIIIFSLFIIGYIIIDLFYGAFSIVLNFNRENDWFMIPQSLGLSGTGSAIFIFFVIILSMGYLNLLLKNILQYINAK